MKSLSTLLVIAFWSVALIGDLAETFFTLPPQRMRWQNKLALGGMRRRDQGPDVVPPLRFPPGAFGVRIPVRLPSLDPNRIIRFQLYTRDNPRQAEIIEPGKLDAAATRFRSNRSTKVLVHGFVDSATESSSGEWMTLMRNAYLNTSDVNVIVVNYSFLALFLFQWTNLPQVSSRRLSSLIYALHKDVAAPYESFHLIGRSWGVHVVGMAGYALNGKVARITGLDPASPPLRFMNFEYRLDKSDARFVDVYHLNGKGRIPLLDVLGVAKRLAAPMGHVDVYPNYRERQVTGCPMNNASSYTPSCMLGLGARLYIETIVRKEAFPVCPCESFTKYIRGQCTCEARNYVTMGEHIPMDTKGVFQLLTIRVEADDDSQNMTTSRPFGNGTGLIPIIGLTTKPTTVATTTVASELSSSSAGSETPPTTTKSTSTASTSANPSSTDSDGSFVSEDTETVSSNFVTKDGRSDGRSVTLVQTSVPNLYISSI